MSGIHRRRWPGAWLAAGTLLFAYLPQAGAEPRDAPLVRLEKEHLPAGAGGQLLVEIEAPPNHKEMPELLLSAGSGSCCEEVAPGRWRAGITPPAVRHPMPVIVAAKFPGLPPAWAVLKLHSRTRLAIKTDKPFVTVTLRVGERSYGPVRTDTEGNGAVEVEVWPGESEGTAAGVDEFGNRSTQKVPIPLPAVPLLVAMPERRQLAADGLSELPIWVVQTDASGQPSNQAAFAIRLNGGRVKQTVKRADGLFRLDLQAPRGKSLERLLCEISDRRQPQLEPLKIGIQLGVGRPRRIEVRLEPNRLPADGFSEAWLQLRVLDAADNPVEGASLRVDCSAGRVVRLTEEQPGVKDGAYLAPTGVQGEVSCQAVAEGEAAEASFSLFLERPRVDLLLAEADLPALPADGRSQAKITLRAEAANGRALEGVNISGSAAAGTLSRVIEDGGGRYHALYTAPALKAVEKVRLEFSAGEGESRRTAWVNLRLEPPSEPPLPLARFSIGLWGGVSSDLGALTLPAFGLEAALRLPFAKGMFRLALEGEFRFLRDSRAAEQQGQPAAMVERNAGQVGLLLVFQPTPEATLSPFLEAGGGAAFFGARVKPEGGTPVYLERVSYLVLAGGGGELRLGATTLFLKVRYHRDTLPGGALARYGLSGNSSGLEAGAGLRLSFY